jgi:hypothetical protein
VSLSSDNEEIYVSTQTDIVKVIDQGLAASVEWSADLTAYVPGAADRSNFNLLLAGIAANGVNFLAGAGLAPGVLANIGLPFSVGYGVLDRETGAIRYFADGLDESIAELNVAPDGAYYNANSPIRRAFAHALFPTQTPEIQGGIRKFAPRRVDLLIRDGVCAARDRAVNAAVQSATCPASAVADVDQIDDLIAQARRVAPTALGNGDLTTAKWTRLDAALTTASGADLGTAANALGAACTLAAPCPAAPRVGCRTAARSKLMLRRKPARTPNVDLLNWSWSKGAATTSADFAAPSTTTDYAVCVYAGAPGSETLVYESGLPASPAWTTRPRGWRYADRRGSERGIRRLVLKSGAAGKSEIGVRATGAGYFASRFPVAAPVTAQLVELDAEGCYESSFTAGEVQTSDARVFKAKN